jgi:hypothetical protein
VLASTADAGLGQFRPLSTAGDGVAESSIRYLGFDDAGRAGPGVICRTVTAVPLATTNRSVARATSRDPN